MPRKRQRVESPKSVDVENQPWYGLKKVTSMLRSTVFGCAPADTTEQCFSTWNHASAYNGASVVYATDETLGFAENMLKFDSPSGWWTRRRRSTGQEFAIIELAGAVRVDAVYLQLGPRSERPPFISLTGSNMCSSVFEDVRRMQLNKSAQTESDVVEWLDRHEADWHEITHIEPTGDKSRLILKALDDHVVCSHLLLNLHPDGHVADLRIYGQAQQQTEPSSPLGQAFSAMACIPLHATHPFFVESLFDNGFVWRTPRTFQRPPVIFGPQNGRSLHCMTNKEESLVFRLMRPASVRQIRVYFEKGQAAYQVAVQYLYHPALLAMSVEKQMYVVSSNYLKWTDLSSEIVVDETAVLTPSRRAHSAITHVKLAFRPDAVVKRVVIDGSSQSIPQNPPLQELQPFPDPLPSLEAMCTTCNLVHAPLKDDLPDMPQVALSYPLAAL